MRRARRFRGQAVEAGEAGGRGADGVNCRRASGRKKLQQAVLMDERGLAPERPRKNIWLQVTLIGFTRGRQRASGLVGGRAGGLAGDPRVAE